jgi:RHS repeat-associated protein
MDRPVALLTGAQTWNTTRYLHQDQIGNVIGVTNNSNAVVQQFDYSPWGTVTTLVNQLADTNRLQWKGLVFEGGTTNLSYVRNRWYDPEARRFLSEDPIGLDGGMNLYAFARNDPVNFEDPYGLNRCTDFGKSIGGTDIQAEDGSWWCQVPLTPMVITARGGQWPSGFSDNFGNSCTRGGICAPLLFAGQEGGGPGSGIGRIGRTIINILIGIMGWREGERIEPIEPTPPIVSPDPRRPKDPKKDDPETGSESVIQRMRDFLRQPVPSWIPNFPPLLQGPGWTFPGLLPWFSMPPLLPP